MKAHRSLFALLLCSAMPLTAQAQTIPPETGTGTDEEIVVTGLRESLKTSVAIKRNAGEVVESITADDIGKLPDPNVAETLSRVPGVQAYRFGGEASSPVGNGSGLTIRGLTGQTGSRVDGRAYFTAGGREFNIEGASPGMVAGVNVYKNPSAEHIEGAIGGLVDIRSRRPFDFRGTVTTAAIGGRYNDLAKTVGPDVFGLVSTRFDTGMGEMGLLLSGSFSKTFNRSDNNPGNGGISLRRAIRADSAEYAANPALDRRYVGRSDVTWLADVPNPLALTAEQRAGLITTVTQNATVNQEDIQRTRTAYNAAWQWRPTPTLELHAEGLYTEYFYHQNYRFLNPVDSRYVQGLTTAAFAVDEALANRNANGGANELLAGQRLASGTFLGSTFTTTGGGENRRYTTYVVAGGAKWTATDRLEVTLDTSYVKADQYQDNRSVVLSPASAAASWDITRDLTGSPHDFGFTGPDVAAPATWVFNNYSNGTRQTFDDDGIAVALDARYKLDGILRAVRVGGRYATQNDFYRNFSFSGRPLTTNGLALAADRSNAIAVTAQPQLIQTSPTNWLAGKAGYSGGYLTYGSDRLFGDIVRNVFPATGLAADDALAETLLNRREFREKTYAGYIVGDFALADDRIKGNAGVRVVRTDTFTRAQVQDTSTGTTRIVPNERRSDYTDVLPTFNLSANLTDRTIARFGYGKGITRPELSALNPTVIIDSNTGNGTIGNADLRPQKADSFDLSLEHYFSAANYVSVGLFYKKIDGFFSGIEQCQAVATAPAYSGIVNNNCPTGQYRLTQTVNGEKGSARGVELAVQTFLDYDFIPTALHGFGVSGSFTYVDTVNPLTLNGQRVDTQQPFTSKYNFTTSGFYEDDVFQARLVYTHRSSAILFGVTPNPIDGRYIGAFGLLDASLGVKITPAVSLAINASNLTNAAANRYVGEPGYQTGIERQHFVNGRVFGLTLRYSQGR